ncbi:phospholipase A [Caenimonas terrae]|uniref:Phospholipase A1 n=1 Tax=Caenimonas terrae TaxID=696074 RepID=A0ABW0N9L5_9BURK
MLRSCLRAAVLCIALPAAATDSAGWQACMALADAGARLACFDRWAQSAAPAQPAAVPEPVPQQPQPVAQAPAAGPPSAGGCHDRRSTELSRFWELEAASDCGTFDIRGYRAISLSVVKGNVVNTEPKSGNPANSAPTAQDYGTTETRLQLSVRTKLAANLLTRANPAISDSLWFGYTQQSYWQVFNGGISRPFRSTDHEPELIYVYPSDYTMPAGWRLRYTGLGVVHQSNGQTLPLSRSWNRVYLMAGAEHARGVRLQGRVWRRLPESSDDNPGISDYIGRAELVASWDVNRQNVLAATLRHSLSHSSRGSLRLEWLRAIGTDSRGAPAGLRLHTQLFSGYGDSLLDYNFRRTVLSVGLSLVDW